MAAKTSEPSHSCEICGVDGLTDEEMRSHVVLHVGEASSCPFCDLSDVSPNEMLIHVNSSHLDYLTPESEMFSFIDDDDDDDITQISQTPPKLNGWSEKKYYNNNTESIPCTSSAAGSNGSSPLRSQLNLNLRNKVTPLPYCQQCPMCSYKSSMPLELEEHLNRAHFDLTSPCVPGATTLPANDYRCPICVQTFKNTPDLELHVNIEHKDVLSPGNVGVLVLVYNFRNMLNLYSNSNSNNVF